MALAAQAWAVQKSAPNTACKRYSAGFCSRSKTKQLAKTPAANPAQRRKSAARAMNKDLHDAKLRMISIH
ncbi:hypothetical protein AB6724_13960 [Comamonas guangdongensis]|uniref:Uncharacterized protein n=1 Tax=Comamonas guangdongensis TaxID=510515 RepID=A0ABV3ZWJ4_9BURK